MEGKQTDVFARAVWLRLFKFQCCAGPRSHHWLCGGPIHGRDHSRDGPGPVGQPPAATQLCVVLGCAIVSLFAQGAVNYPVDLNRPGLAAESVSLAVDPY
eukprot:scaffold195044_cov28-Prasinocladus_malaysianus.AAC.1